LRALSTPSKTASVEFAARNGKAGQRIERIVLDDADEPPGPHHAPHLVHEMRPFGWRDVVQHADRGHQIEAGVVEGKAPAVEGAVVDVAVVGARPRDAGRGNVNTAQTADHAAQQRMKAADAAADIEHGGLFRPEPPRDQFAQ